MTIDFLYKNAFAIYVFVLRSVVGCGTLTTFTGYRLEQCFPTLFLGGTYEISFHTLRNPYLGIRFFIWCNSPPVGQGQGLLIHEVSRSHTQRRTTVGITPLDE